MIINDLAANLIAALIFAVLGILILAAAIMLFEKLTPGVLWKELIEDQNTAIAILMAGIAIGVSIIIAAAVH
jgi:putative membrane protein